MVSTEGSKTSSDGSEKNDRVGHLNNHEKIHTGEEPFRCTECDKSYSRFDALKSHKLVHTSEKSFK